MKEQLPSKESPDRLPWTGVMVILLPLIVFSLLLAFFLIAFRSDASRHPFSISVFKAVSPDGKVTIEERDEGDDEDAITVWTIYATGDPENDPLSLPDPSFESVRWRDNRTLEFSGQPQTDGDINRPTNWHDVHFVYVDLPPRSPKSDPAHHAAD